MCTELVPMSTAASRIIMAELCFRSFRSHRSQL
jgi:hypothetical protein